MRGVRQRSDLHFVVAHPVSGWAIVVPRDHRGPITVSQSNRSPIVYARLL